MANDGWIKLYRKTQQSDMYKNLNSKQRDVMINCLMLANHQTKSWEWNGEIYTCKPGQFITSLSNLQKVCAKDVSIQNIRTAIKKLEKWQFLTNKSTKSGRLITIVNWGKYQSGYNETNKDNNKELTKSQQRTNKELTTNKNVKNDNNDKEDNNIVTLVRTFEKIQTKKFKKILPPDERPKFDEDSIPYKAAVYLRDKIKENHPRQPLPDKNAKDMEDWSVELERLNRLGTHGAKNQGYTWEEIREIIDWCQDDSFWKKNILSASKFRRKIVQLESKMENDSSYKKPKKSEKVMERYERAIEEDQRREGTVNE